MTTDTFIITLATNRWCVEKESIDFIKACMVGCWHLTNHITIGPCGIAKILHSAYFKDNNTLALLNVNIALQYIYASQRYLVSVSGGAKAHLHYHIYAKYLTSIYTG